MASRISLPQPCPASWADMTPASGGRHCAACNKVVVDFTSLTEAETVAALRQPDRVCGRFRQEQINPLASWAPWLAAAVLTLSSCETSSSAGSTLSPELPAKETLVHQDSILVRGKVVDKGSGQPLAQAIIISEQDTSFHTRTDAEGTFALLLPRSLRGTQLVAAQPEPAHLTPDDPEPGLYIPRYFSADESRPIVIRLRNPGPMIGMPVLEPQENYSPAVMSRVMHLAPPPKISH
ncbi:peptidase associated/transthyretin-like domain-containing protein [Hymenobacter swuensis]|uniref:Carboxypeptidase regulatory-like domain-containing protein n=1 Tax=Hymenobacter swuensis DY53 TaxID=1227739 RepID=W8F6P2_9BACT|nr:hypothetical protein [Hymenobacter swuensis]AHJ99697.1 hypothetical protein Hsw_4102 [Hymenobacter swuensis DY53]